MKELKIDLLQLLKWIMLISIIPVLAWYVFGQTPDIWQIFTFIATVVFAFLAFDSYHNDRQIVHKLNTHDSKFEEVINKLDEKFDEQTSVLKDIRDAVRKD